MCKTVLMLSFIFLIQIGGFNVGKDGIYVFVCVTITMHFILLLKSTRVRPVKPWPGQETLSKDQRTLL